VDRLRARHGAGAVLPARVVGARPDEQTSRFGPPRKG
jgi:hypothetical protein